MRNATTLIVLGITLFIACNVLIFGYRMLNHADNFVSDKNDEAAMSISSIEQTRFNDYNNKTVNANQVQAAINRWGNQLEITIVDNLDSYGPLVTVPESFDSFAQNESIVTFSNGVVKGIVFTKL